MGEGFQACNLPIKEVSSNIVFPRKLVLDSIHVDVLMEFTFPKLNKNTLMTKLKRVQFKGYFKSSI